MSQRIEMLLYHGLDPTGSIEISTTSSSGPWTKLTRTLTAPVSVALAEWTSLANAAEPARDWGFAFYIEDTSQCCVDMLCTGGTGWVRMHPTLARLIGHESLTEIDDTFVTSPYRPVGATGHALDSSLNAGPHAVCAFGVTYPVSVEEAELVEYRGGRFASHHYGRISEVTLDLVISPELWALAEDSPIFGGHCAMLVWNSDDPHFPDGLYCFPIEELKRDDENPESDVYIRYRCSVRDAAESPNGLDLGPLATRWQQLTAGLPYGYGGQWFARLEGIPTLWAEVIADAIPPVGYDIDSTLVIDRCPRLGSDVTKGPIPNAFNGDLRLLDSPTVRTYFGTRPRRTTYLTAPLAADDTTATVDNARAWSGLTEIYIGSSCLPFSGRTDQTFTGLDRAVYGRARSYAKGTPISDGPSTFLGKFCELLFNVLDPLGAYVQGDDVLDGAAKRWCGYVASRPKRDGIEWTMSVRDQVRRLADPIGVAASGVAVWTDDDDALVPVPVSMVYACKVALQPTSALVLDVRVQPFTAYAPGDMLRQSEIRTVIITALTAASTDPQVNGFKWVKRPHMTNVTANVWMLYVELTAASTDTQCLVVQTEVYNVSDYSLVAVNGAGFTPIDGTGVVLEERPLYLMQPTTVLGVVLAIVLDEGDPAAIPTEGMVVLEANGHVDYARYLALEIDPLDPYVVRLTLEPRDQFFGQDLINVLVDTAEISARFQWAAMGHIKDILRRTIVSTGDAQHGDYDVWPKGQGLGLPHIDADSFDRVFQDVFEDLTFSVYEDADASVEDLFGGVLQLSRRALATRCSADGERVEIAAVDVGPTDSGVPVITITEDRLIAVPGRRPVRVKDVFNVPQMIECKTRLSAIGDVAGAEASVTFRDPHLTDWTDAKLDLDIFGITRDALVGVGGGWALSTFRAGETRQVIEVDVAPWDDAQIGDTVLVDLPDPTLWDYALGVPGYLGLALVVGDVMPPTTLIRTLSLACDGIFGMGPFAPSLPLFAVNGTPTAPTSIDVEDKHYALLMAAKNGESTWRIKCYVPGDEGLELHQWLVGDVSLPGGGVARITVVISPSSPTITLTTDHHLTWPEAPNCTPNQARYLHNTDEGQFT